MTNVTLIKIVKVDKPGSWGFDELDLDRNEETLTVKKIDSANLKDIKRNVEYGTYDDITVKDGDKKYKVAIWNCSESGEENQDIDYIILEDINEENLIK